MKPLIIYLDSELNERLPLIRDALKGFIDSGDVILQEDTPDNAVLGFFNDAPDRFKIDWSKRLPFIHFEWGSNDPQATLIHAPVEIIEIVTKYFPSDSSVIP